MRKEKLSLSASAKKRVLLAPLDWGLGHATRCIPIIHELSCQNTEVWIACDNGVHELLKNELTNVNFLSLKGYRIQYSRQKSLFTLKILRQFPKIIMTYLHEKRWMKRMQKEYQFSAIISDNRPGIRVPGVHSVYITHQLHIQTGQRLSTWISNRMHRYFIRKFDACWVPDVEKDGLSGMLSHPPINQNIEYIGPLSRMQHLEVSPHKHDLLCVLSGPEPQRTQLEQILVTLATRHRIPALIIRGLPAEEKTPPAEGMIQFRNHLPAAQLNAALLASPFIICRAGYTTIMDLARLRLPALLIPTPGQPEQEYLAGYLSAKDYFKTSAQKQLPTAFEAYLGGTREENRLPEYDFARYKASIQRLVTQLNDCNFVP